MKDKLNGYIFRLRNTIYWRKYNNIWDKVSADIEKEFDSVPIYNKKQNTKIKYHGDEVIDFYDKNIPTVDFCDLFSSNYLGFCPQERWQLLSASVLKIV